MTEQTIIEELQSANLADYLSSAEKYKKATELFMVSPTKLDEFLRMETPRDSATPTLYHKLKAIKELDTQPLVKYIVSKLVEDYLKTNKADVLLIRTDFDLSPEAATALIRSIKNKCKRTGQGISINASQFFTQPELPQKERDTFLDSGLVLSINIPINEEFFSILDLQYMNDFAIKKSNPVGNLSFLVPFAKKSVSIRAEYFFANEYVKNWKTYIDEFVTELEVPIVKANNFIEVQDVFVPNRQTLDIELIKVLTEQAGENISNDGNNRTPDAVLFLRYNHAPRILDYLVEKALTNQGLAENLLTQNIHLTKEHVNNIFDNYPKLSHYYVSTAYPEARVKELLEFMANRYN